MPTPTFDMTTIGETMLRLSVPAGERLEHARRLDLFPAGAEANIASALSRLGHRCAWLGGLPDSSLGRIVANQLRMAGVNLDGVIWDPDGRMGTYFVEFAAPPRPIQVIYDRADSVAANLQPAQINWDLLLDTRLIHLTGITPALTSNSRAIVEEAIRRAKAANVPVGFDVNYRGKLWSPQDAADTIIPLVQEIDLFFCGQGDARTLFNIEGDPEDAVRQLADLSHAQTVVMSIGDRGAVAWDGARFYHEAAFPVEVIDRIGAGDALAAGIVHGWLRGDLAAGLRYGVAMAALALSQYGDMVTTNQAELDAVLENAGGGVNR
ncbi:MAG: sugar kinase [Caldilineaceae bacterium]|nr:sugar kinase [Caldilineaceae bacterium]